jgi:hypothetical protein
MALLQSKLGQKKNTRSLRQGRQSLFLIILTLLVTTAIEARLAFLRIMQGDEPHSFVVIALKKERHLTGFESLSNSQKGAISLSKNKDSRG